MRFSLGHAHIEQRSVHSNPRPAQDAMVYLAYYAGIGANHSARRPWVQQEGWRLETTLASPAFGGGAIDEIRTKFFYAGSAEVRGRSWVWVYARVGGQRRKVSPNRSEILPSSPNRPQRIPRSSPDRPNIDRISTPRRPHIHPRSTLDRLQVDPVSTLNRTPHRCHIDPKWTPDRPRMGGGDPTGCGDPMVSSGEPIRSGDRMSVGFPTWATATR